jgi:hypothetical protein
MTAYGGGVERTGNRISFSEDVSGKTFSYFLSALGDARSGGHEDITIDLRYAARSFADGVVPMICSLDHLRRDGVEFGVELPEDNRLQRLYIHNNWAHLLYPERYRESLSSNSRHLSTRRYATLGEQKALVDAVLDIVMRNMEVERSVLAGLEWSLNEITDNVLNHAQAPEGGIVQAVTFQNNQKITFIVADAGRGVLASLQEGYPALSTDDAAISEAVRQGVTRNPSAGQGNGLAGTLRIASASGGSFTMISGRGHLAVFSPGGSGDYQERLYVEGEGRYFQGCSVYAEIGTEYPFALEEALSFHGTPYLPVDVIELAYMTETGDDLILRLSAETSGFGTRLAGDEIRRKVTNLLNAEPTKRIILDWAGIPLISSSFADAAVGKLFVLLGPLGFSSRVQMVGLEPLVRKLVDRAIMQRVVQAQQEGQS